jgi:hypothetical protein
MDHHARHPGDGGPHLLPVIEPVIAQPRLEHDRRRPGPHAQHVERVRADIDELRRLSQEEDGNDHHGE